jgi:TRAP transporter 4TM/12TM fusion protein
VLSEEIELIEQKSNPFIFKIIYVIAIAFAVFQLWMASYGLLTQNRLRATHLGFALVLIYFTMLHRSIKQGNTNWARALIGLFGVVTSVVITVYIDIVDQQLIFHLSNPSHIEIILGVVAILLVLEAARYMVGWFLPFLALIAIVYVFVGRYLPNILAHPGYDLDRLVSTIYLGTEGLYGAPIGASATFVAIFVVFGALLQSSGAGQVFVDFAFSLFGRVRGGPAKIAVISSSLFGAVSGSPVANVVGTGSLTIPLMIRTGYKPHVAGAIEAVASTGGQIVPPVLGAAAFLMAEVVGIPYLTIVGAAIIPAIIYYVSLFCMVDFEAAKSGLKGLDRSQLPKTIAVLKAGWLLLLPLLVLMYLLVILKMSPMISAFWACVAIFVCANLRKATRMNWKKLMDALYNGGMGILEVAIACATAGIIIGVLNLTGLGLRFSGLLVSFSGGHLWLLLVLAAAASIILGMGLPAVGVYLILSVLVAPALVQLGVPILAAHFFIFYFGVLSSITPPIALAAYAAAGIAKTNPMKTGMEATRLAIAGFLFPFMFVRDPALLLQGDFISILFGVGTAIIGALALAAALQGYPLTGRTKAIKRVLSFVAALFLMDPTGWTNIIGFIILLLLVSVEVLNRIKLPKREIQDI